MAMASKERAGSRLHVPDMLVQKKVLRGNYYHKTTGVMTWIPKEQQAAEFAARKAKAAKAASDISAKLGLSRREALANVIPEIYREESVDPISRERSAVAGTGALVIRAFIDKRIGSTVYRREEQVWIDDNHRELPDDSTTFLGAIANERANDGFAWEITHFVDPAVSGYVTPRERALGPLVPAVQLEPAPAPALVVTAALAA
jgi:hypothetical protein